MTQSLPNLATLVELAGEPSSDKRRELLRSVTDLFFQEPENYNESEINLFGDVMGSIASDLETEIRLDIAQRMSTLPNPPMNLIQDLAKDEIAVAQPILQDSPALDDDLLIDIAQHQSQDHIMAMTKRPNVSENVSASIVDNGNDHVVASLLENDGAEISRPTMEQVVERAAGSEILHKPIVGRSNIPPDLLNEMFFSVSSDLKEHILKRNESLDPNVVEDIIQQSHNDFSKKGSQNETISPAEKFINEAEENRELTESFLVDLLRNRKLAEFLYGFSRLAELDVKTAKRVLQDKSAEALAIACKASRFDRATFSTFVLLTDANQQRTPSEVNVLMDLYTEVSIETAQRTIRFWRIRKAAADQNSKAA
jgi:uncharacterized protein (DUF2336 family)